MADMRSMRSASPEAVRSGAAPRLRVLVACEFSGVVRDAFAALGHDAWSCDLRDTERPGQHIKGDAVAAANDSWWDVLIAHPPCTYLSRAGARWWGVPGRAELARKAADFALELANAPVMSVAVENPIGMLNGLWRYPDQTIQPWEYGHPYSKATCLWLRGLPPLMPTMILSERRPYLPSNTGSGRRAGQSSSRGVATTSKERSRTFQGIAGAMALQWGGDARQPELPQVAESKLTENRDARSLFEE